jgi:hypothetical protein
MSVAGPHTEVIRPPHMSGGAGPVWAFPLGNGLQSNTIFLALILMCVWSCFDAHMYKKHDCGTVLFGIWKKSNRRRALFYNF